MTITEVWLKEPRMKKNVYEAKYLLKIASITIDDCFAVKDIKLNYDKKRNNYWIEFPVRKAICHKEGNGFYSLAYPITKGCRQQILNAIILEYLKEERKTESL